MRLGELIRGLEVLQVHGDLGVEISDISSDSRLIRGGELFVAIRGERANGHGFLREAVSRGARALLVEDPPSGIGVPWVQVRDTRVALGEVASRFYGQPSLGLKVVGITGTNGKTTSCYLLESILKAHGAKVGVIGTVSYRWMDQQREAQNTTPSSLELQRLLREMLDSGVTHVVMEVSSHALVQRRLKGCHFDIGIFTNISPEHLDYHGTMREYLRAKALFFQEVLKESQKDPWAIYNADDPKVREVVEGVEGLKEFGFGVRGLVRPIRWRADLEGISFELETPRGPLEARSRLVGYHNLYNIMAAVSAAIILDVDIQAICRGIEGLKGVPGRLERVSEKPKVFVDYAHTPDALQKVLEALRPLT
ncbi:MAG: UDP-N-acetylmuramoyl-L-alanyl-D-glutamate--2,6-diaminopimelate ligase, partial [Deltaproteobacteria bacterium]